VDRSRIWFEATSPTRGADGTADQVPELPEDGAFWVPNDKLVLRYLNSISDRQRQYRGWLEKGIVKPDDAYVMALNPRKIGFEHADTDPPRILQAAFAIGSLYAAIDRETMKVTRTGYQFRDSIAKEGGASVSSGLFHRKEYSNLSGLLCSRVDPVNRPELMGHDFQLVPNPEAGSSRTVSVYGVHIFGLSMRMRPTQPFAKPLIDQAARRYESTSTSSRMRASTMVGEMPNIRCAASCIARSGAARYSQAATRTGRSVHG
jgi:hypothetical protein